MLHVDETFILFVFILVSLGVIKDIIMLSQWFEKWLRKKNGDPKSPASLEVLGVLLREHSDYIIGQAQRQMDTHFTALMAENQRTNYLLHRFLIGQQMIAKVAHGIDLPDAKDP